MKYRKTDEDLLLPRSQNRKRARAVLQEQVEMGERKQECEKCGWKPDKQSRESSLDVDHRNKNTFDNDPANLRYLCRPHHKQEDSKTEKGVSQLGETFGYDLDNL